MLDHVGHFRALPSVVATKYCDMRYNDPFKISGDDVSQKFVDNVLGESKENDLDETMSLRQKGGMPMKNVGRGAYRGKKQPQWAQDELEKFGKAQTPAQKEKQKKAAEGGKKVVGGSSAGQQAGMSMEQSEDKLGQFNPDIDENPLEKAKKVRKKHVMKHGDTPVVAQGNKRTQKRMGTTPS